MLVSVSSLELFLAGFCSLSCGLYELEFGKIELQIAASRMSTSYCVEI